METCGGYHILNPPIFTAQLTADVARITATLLTDHGLRLTRACAHADMTWSRDDMVLDPQQTTISTNFWLAVKDVSEVCNTARLIIIKMTLLN